MTGSDSFRYWGYRNRGTYKTGDPMMVELEAKGMVRAIETGADWTSWRVTREGCQAIGMSRHQVDRAQDIY